MFSMMPTPAHTHIQLHHHYTPVHPSPLSSSPLRSSPTPSPLSPRDANAPPSSPTHTPACFNHRHPDLMMSPTPTPESITPTRSPSPAPSSARESAYSRRPTKANPLIHRDAQDGRETRRKLFLKKVKDHAADKRYGGEEEMMRRIWLAEEKRREEAIWREAMGLETMMEEEEEVEATDPDEMLVEEIAREEAELEALLELMGEEGGAEETRLQRSLQQSDTPYASDDELYDDIFMDVILEENRTASQQQEERQQQTQHEQRDADLDMMDMS